MANKLRDISNESLALIEQIAEHFKNDGVSLADKTIIAMAIKYYHESLGLK